MKYAAFALTVILALFGGTFLIGETLMDPRGRYAVALAVCWGVVTVALAAYALWRPEAATPVLTAVAVTVAAYVVADLMFGLGARTHAGPVGSACALLAATGLGFLGLRRPAAAGPRLLLVGAAAVGAGASGMALAGPVLLIAALFLLAARGGERRSPDRPRPHGAA